MIKKLDYIISIFILINLNMFIIHINWIIIFISIPIYIYIMSKMIIIIKYLSNKKIIIIKKISKNLNKSIEIKVNRNGLLHRNMNWFGNIGGDYKYFYLNLKEKYYIIILNEDSITRIFQVPDCSNYDQDKLELLLFHTIETGHIMKREKNGITSMGVVFGVRKRNEEGIFKIDNEMMSFPFNNINKKIDDFYKFHTQISYKRKSTLDNLLN